MRIRMLKLGKFRIEKRGIIAVFIVLIILFVIVGFQNKENVIGEKINSKSDSIYQETVLVNEKFFDSVDIGKVEDSNVEQKIREVIIANKQKFEINDNEIVLDSIKQTKDKYFVNFVQKYNGIPVYGGRVTAYVNNNKITYVKSNYYKNINIPTTSKLTEEQAKNFVRNGLINNQKTNFVTTQTGLEDTKRVITQYNSINDFILGSYDINGNFRQYDFSKVNLNLDINDNDIVVYPLNNKYYLTRKIDVNSDELDLIVFIDANNGKIIDVKDNRIYYDVTGTVMGKEWEDPFTDNIHLDKMFKNNFVSINGAAEETDENGVYEFIGLSGTSNLYSALEGPWVIIYNAQLEESQHIFSTNQEIVHNWNWDYDDNSYLDEESNAFYHVNRIHDYAILNGASEMNLQMTTNVNINSVCNAYYVPTTPSIKFLQAGNGCESTGVISDIIYHEYGHGIVHALDPSLLNAGYWDESGNIHEALADYWACTLNDNPNMGEGFFQWDPNGLRICNGDDIYPEDYYPEPHSGAQIISGALWDIREQIGRQNIDPLIINALRLQPITFSELLESLLIVDDDNGDLSDGTPNIEIICDSFLDHGIEYSFCAGFTNFLAHYNNNTNADYALGDKVPVENTGTSIEDGLIENGILINDNDVLSYQTLNNINNNEGTIEFWFKPTWDGNDGEHYNLLSLRKSETCVFKIYKKSDGELESKSTCRQAGIPGDADITYDINGWKSDEWHYIAVSWGNSERRLYVDGILVDIDPYTGPLIYNVINDEINVGNDWYEPFNDANAIIDEFRISNIQRSDEEILDDYNLGKQFVPTQPTGGSSPLIMKIENLPNQAQQKF